MDEIPEGFKKGRRYKDFTDNPDTPGTYDIVERSGSWDKTYGSPEYYEYYRTLRNQRVQSFIEEQAALPEEEKKRPTTEEWNPSNFFDLLSTGEYWSGARLQELKTSFVERRFAFGERSIKEKLEPQQAFYGGKEGANIEATEFRLAGRFGGMVGQEERAKQVYGYGIGLRKFGLNMALDPLNWVSGINAGKKIVLEGMKGTKYTATLTSEGAKIFAMLSQKFPAAAKITDDVGRVIAYEEPKEAIEAFSAMLRDNPKLASKLLEYKGLRLVGTNIGVIPERFIPTSYIAPTFKAGSNAIMSAINMMKAKLADLRPIKKPPDTSGAFNVLKFESELKLAELNKLVKESVDRFETKARTVLKGTPNVNDILRQYIEDPNFRQFHPELHGLFLEVEKLHKDVAKLEMSKGILTSERSNYLLHYVTTGARKILGYGKEKAFAPFNIKRNIETTITNANKEFRAKHGVDLFNPNPFVAITKRLEMHAKTTSTFEFLNKIKQQYGKTAQEASKYKDFVESKQPGMKGVWLHKTVEAALEADSNVKELRISMNMRSSSEKIWDTAHYVGSQAYNFQVWTMNTFSKAQTVFFPAFYAVNFYGGKFMTWLGGSLDFGMDKKAIEMIYKKNPGKVKIVSRLDPRIVYTGEDLDAIFTKFQIKRVDPVGVSGGLRALQKWGWDMEYELRSSMMMKRLEDGDTPEQAYKYMTQFHFDYTTELRGVEKVVSDFVPFFRWNMNAIPFFADMALRSHAKMQTMTVLAQGTWNTPQGQVVQSYMPNYAQNMNLFYMGGNQSTVAGINNPAETTGTFIQRMNELRQGNPLNMTQYLSPMITMGIEEARGQTTFSGKPIQAQVPYLAEHWFPRWFSTGKKLGDPSIPAWENAFELGLGGRVYSGVDWVFYSGVLEMNANKLVNNAIRRTRGKYNGCGF